MRFEQDFVANLSAGMWTSLKFLALLAVVVLLALLLLSCSTHTVSITPLGINATSTALLYCPEATVTRITDGNRTVDVLSETSGVGAVVQEVLKP